MRRCNLDASTSRPARSATQARLHGTGLWTESVTSLCSDTAGFAKLALREDGEPSPWPFPLTADPNLNPSPNPRPNPNSNPNSNANPEPNPDLSQARTLRWASLASVRRSTCCIAARHILPLGGWLSPLLVAPLLGS